MANQKQNTDFAEEVFPTPSYPLDDAIDWIGAHMDPEDVFSSTDLIAWADANGFVLKED